MQLEIFKRQKDFKFEEKPNIPFGGNVHGAARKTPLKYSTLCSFNEKLEQADEDRKCFIHNPKDIQSTVTEEETSTYSYLRSGNV